MKVKITGRVHVQTLQQQSLKLFPVAADFLCRLLPDPRICNNSVQVRRGNNLKRVNDFNLNTKAVIWL